jgi:Tfp pilus assembly protein PilO
MLVVAGFASALVPLAAYAFVVRPQAVTGLTAQEQRLERGAKELHALEVTANKFEEFKRESELLDEQLTLLEKVLPREPAAASLVARLRELAVTDRLMVVEAKPLHEGDTTTSLEVALQGAPADFASFTTRLPRIARLVAMERVEIERRSDGTFDFRLRLVAHHLKG